MPLAEITGSYRAGLTKRPQNIFMEFYGQFIKKGFYDLAKAFFRHAVTSIKKS